MTLRRAIFARPIAPISQMRRIYAISQRTIHPQLWLWMYHMQCDTSDYSRTLFLAYEQGCHDGEYLPKCVDGRCVISGLLGC